jgi:hypothetical protein
MLRCSICGIHTEDAQTALDSGWLPYFFDGVDEQGPCCPECFDALLYLDCDGEPRLKDEYRGRIVYREEYLVNEASDSEPQLVFN